MADNDQDRFCWDGAAAPALSAAAPAGRRCRRLPWAAVAAVAAAIAAVLMLSGGGGVTRSATVLARAADVTTDVPGYRFKLTLDASGAGHSVAMDAWGVRHDVGRLAAALPLVPGSAGASGLRRSRTRRRRGHPLDVWVDAQDRVGRLALSPSLQADSRTAQLSLALDLYDHGPQPEVSAPPSDQVTDLSGGGGQPLSG